MWPGTIPFTVSRTPNPRRRGLYYACGVKGFNIPDCPICPSRRSSCLTSSSSSRQGSAGRSKTGLISCRSGRPRPAPAGPPAGPPDFQAGDSAPAPARRVLRARESSVAAVDHGDRHIGGDAAPIFPAVELREIVSAHDPDKVHAGNAAAQMDDRIDSVAGPNDSFETADIDARVVGGAPRASARSASACNPSWFLSGLPGVSSHQTRSSCSRLIANRLMARCAACGGLKEPPSRPIRMPLV